jgi:hypothetical protein
MLNATTVGFAAASLVFFAQGAGEPQAQGGERQVQLVNDGRQPIVEIYASDDDGADWQSDLLGSDFLPPGGSVLVDIDDRDGNCRISLKTVFDDGSNRIERGVGICLDDGHAVALR